MVDAGRSEPGDIFICRSMFDTFVGCGFSLLESHHAIEYVVRVFGNIRVSRLEVYGFIG